MIAERRERGHTGLWLLAAWVAVTASWWALALAPLSDPPPWLAVARSVCFGATPTGLPDTYGWLLLTMAPLSMLVGIVGVWSVEIVADVTSAWQRGPSRAALLAVGAVLAAGVAWSALRVSEGLAVANMRYEPGAASPLPSNYPRLDREVPEFALVDQAGRSFTPAELRGHVTLLTFAFAHCHSVCPVIVNTLRTAAYQLGAAAPQIVVITLDPWRDTPSRLPQMHKDWGLPESTRVLSGEVEAVTRALDDFKVPWVRNEKNGDVVHPALVYALDAQGRIAFAFNNPTVDWLVEAAARLGASPATAASGG